MTLTMRRRDPFRTLWAMPSLSDEDWFDRSGSGQGLSLYETDESVVVEANVAGVPEDMIEISIEGGTVTIKAHYEESEESKKAKTVVYRQSSEASYAYSVSLPTPVDQSKADASVEHGILKIILPKKEEAKPKKIEIKAKKS